MCTWCNKTGLSDLSTAMILRRRPLAAIKDHPWPAPAMLQLLCQIHTAMMSSSLAGETCTTLQSCRATTRPAYM